MSSEVIHVSTGDKLGFAVSILLHLLVGAGLMGAFGGNSSKPFGFQRQGDPTWIEIGIASQGAQMSSRPSQKKLETRAQDREDVIVKSKPDTPEAQITATHQLPTQDSLGAAQSGQFGLRDGTVAKGPVGSATGAQVSERDRYLYELKILLEGRKTYPQMARQRGESGRVIVRFQVQPDGQIEAVEIADPSEFHRLNQAAIELVKGVRRYKPFTGSIGVQTLTLEVPIEYVLN